jgi:phage-related minor tail protein
VPFPTLGLKFDLSEIIAANAALKELRAEILQTAEARDRLASKSASSGVVAAAREEAAAQKSVGDAAKSAGAAKKTASEGNKAAILAENAALIEQVERYQKLRQVLTLAQASGKPGASPMYDLMAAKAAAGQITDLDKRTMQGLLEIEKAANAERITQDRALLNSRIGLRSQEAGLDDSYIQANLKRRQAFWAEQAKGEVQASNASRALMRAEAEAENRTFDARTKLLADYERAAALSQNRLFDQQVAADARFLRQEATTEAKFVEMLRLRSAANVPTSPNQVSLYKATAQASNYGPSATAAIAEIEAVNQALADANKAAAGAAFLAELQQLSDFGVKLGPTAAAMKALKAEQLGVGAAAGPMIDGLKKAGHELANVGGMSTRVREGFVLLREAGRGDFTRMAGSLSIEAQALGLMSKILSPMGLLITAVTAAFIGFFVVMEKGAEDVAKFNNALKATGGFAGVIFDDMAESAKKLAEATNNTTTKTLEAIQAVVASGRVGGAAVQETAEAAVRLADLTGQKVDAVVSKLTGMYGNAAQGAAQLNESVHFLTLAQYEQIEALEKAGDRAGAFGLAIHDLADHLRQEGTPEMGFFERAIHDVHTWLDKAIEKVKEFGRSATPLMQVTHDMHNIDTLQNLANQRPNDPTVRQELNDAYAKLQKDQDALAEAQSKAQRDAYAARTADEGIAAHRYLQQVDPSLGGSKARMEQEINDYKSQVAAALRADPNDAIALADQANMEERLRRIRKKYDRADYGGRTHSTSDIQNRLGAQSGRIEGLTSDILNPKVDRVSEINAQIETAGLQAAGGFQYGRRSAFQQTAADNAEQLKRLEILKQVNDELAKQTRAEQTKTEVDKAMAAAQSQASAAQVAYYNSGQSSFSGDILLQQQLVDIQEKAQEQQNALNVAQQAGGRSMESLYADLMGIKGATAEVVTATVGHAQALLDAKNAGDQNAASIKKQQIAEEALVRASQAWDSEQRRIRDLVSDSNLSPVQRDAEAYVRLAANALNAERILAKLPPLSEQEAEAQVRVSAELQKQIEYWAQLKIQIQDSIRSAFIDTGKLDFKGLKDGLKKAFRQAIYDSLIAKPIDIVINASVNMVNQLTTSLFKPFTDQITGGIASIFGQGGAANDNSPMSSLLAPWSATVNKLTDQMSGVQANTAGILGAARSGGGGFFGNLGGAGGVAGLALLASSLIGGKTGSKVSGGIQTGLMAGLGAGLGGSALGALGGALVLNTGALGAGAVGAAGMGLAGLGAGLMALAGPIAIVAGLAAVFLKSKPSNQATLATLTPDSYSVVRTNKSTDETIKAADGLASAIVQGEKLIKDAGIKASQYVTQVDIGTRDVPAITFSGEGKMRLGAVGDAAAAADAALKHLLEGATYVSAAEETMVKSMLAAGASFDAIAEKLKLFAEAQDFLKSIDRDLLKRKDPQAAALAELRDNQIARRQQAIGYYQQGVLSSDDLTTLQGKLKELEKLEIIDALNQFTGATNDATATMQEFADAQKKILDYADGLLTSDLSPLSGVDKFNAAQSAFQTMLAKAQGGDRDALGGITGAADSYLREAKNMYASTSSYGSIFDQVQAALRALAAQPGPTATADGGAPISGDSQAVVSALSALQEAITSNNADLITAIATPANDGPTSQDVQDQTAQVVAALGGVQTAVAQSAEAITTAIYTTGGVETPMSFDQMAAGGYAA